MKRAVFKKIGLSLCVAAAALLWTTCNVGLGEAVDNDAPTLTVTGPAKASICQGEIDITGTCNDDKGVKSVNIVLRNTSTGASYSYNGEIDTAAKSASGDYNWKKTVNILDDHGNYPLPDGKYVADVTVVDINGRSSGVSSTAFDIDNTAPFFCVTSPKSLKISSAKVYGRSVTISGEIADDHEIDNMSIRVFRTDASGNNPIEITDYLGKTMFSGFETAGGTTIYIAKYFETANIPDSSSEDYKLYQNYLAMYGTATFGSDIYLYVVPTLTDIAGNTSEYCYVSSELKSRIVERLNDPKIQITSDSLQTAQLQKIYNGTYIGKELSVGQQEIVCEMLQGNDAKSAEYFCVYNDSEKNCFSAIVNSDNSPTYDFSGYENPTASWIGVNTGGTIAITLAAGRDDWGILPNSLVVNLYNSTSAGARGTLAFSSSATEDPTHKATVFIKDATNKETKYIETSVTSQSYYVTLPSLKAGNYYLVEAKGRDENADEDAFNLEPAKPNKYGFKVATSITPPSLSAEKDLFYITGAGVKSDDGEYKFRINIRDEADKIQSNGIKVTGSIYGAHISGKGYINTYTPTRTSEKSYTTAITKVSDNNYYLDLPIKDFGFSIAVDSNYTIALSATAKYQDATGGELWSNPSTFMFWVDNKAPEISIESPKDGENLISEDFSSFEKNVKDDGSVIISITPTGKWSDLGGSNTHRLWYTVDDTGTPTISWTQASGYYVPGTNYYERQAANCYALVDTEKYVAGVDSVASYYTLDLNPSASGKTWTEVADVSQVPSSTSWEQKIIVEEGTGKLFRVIGIDSVGNKSAVVERKPLNYDFEIPTIELTTDPSSNGYYNMSSVISGKITVVLMAKDSFKINKSDVTVAATKDGSVAASGTNGYSWATEQVDGKTVKVTITLTSGGTSDGVWEFSVCASDSAGRTAGAVRPAADYVFTRIVDTVAPTFEVFDNTAPAAIKGKKIAVGSGSDKTKWSDPLVSWYSSTGLVFNGNILEATSGLEKVSYILRPVGSSEDLTGEKTRSGETGKVEFNITATGFEQCVRAVDETLTANQLTIKAVDKAGNKNELEKFYVNIDQSQPSFAAAYYVYEGSTELAHAEGTIMSDGTKAMTVYGTVSSPLSGVSRLDWQIAGSDITSGLTSLEYTTDEVSGPSSYTSATWAALPANSYKVKGWKAVIPAAKLLPGDVFVTAYNKSDRNVKAQIFTIDRDVKAPTIVLNTPDTSIASYKAINAGTEDTTKPTEKPDHTVIPTTVSSVNGTMKISGSVQDDKELSWVKIYWSKNSDADINESRATNPDTEISYTSSMYNWTIENYKFSMLKEGKYYFADGITEFTGSPETLYIKVAAADKAQNKTISVYEYSVNPDSDRPRITLTAPNDLSAMTSSAYVWKKNAAVIRGKVEDDDGLTGLKLYYNDKKEADASSNDLLKWTELPLTSGVFELFNDNEDHDKKHEILFKVVDASETVFVCSDGSTPSWVRPKIYKSTNSSGVASYFGDNSNDDTNVYIQIDTKKPRITNKSYLVNGEILTSLTDDKKIGGTKDNFTLYFYAFDESGLDNDNISFVFNGTTYDTNNGLSVAAEPHDGSGNPALKGYYLVTVADISVATMESETYAGTIRVLDLAGMDRNESVSVEVDNDPPSITSLAPSQTQTVSGSVNAYGTVEGASKTYYALSLSDTSHDDAYVQIAQKSSIMWYLYFDNGVTTEEETHASTLNNFIIAKHVKAVCSDGVEREATAETIENRTFDANVQLYLWVMAEDSVGNYKEEKYPVLLDPQGSRPEVSFSYPSADGDTVGGEVKVYGGAKAKDSSNPTIQAVYAQIVSTTHDLQGYSGGTNFGSISPFVPKKNDWDYLKAAGYTVVKMSDGVTQWTSSNTDTEAPNYGIKATVSGSAWSFTLNKYGELNPESGTNAAAIRVYAFDGNSLSMPETRSFVVDADSPVMGPVYLENSDGSASQEYAEGVYVKGKWYLTFELTDGQGLGEIQIGTGSTQADAQTTRTYLHYDTSVTPAKYNPDVDGTIVKKDATLGYKKISVKYPLETDTPDKCGTQYIYVYFEDLSGKGGENVAKTFKVSYDNIAPELAKTDDPKYSIEKTIQQSNGWHSFGSKVSEATADDGTKQSGFERLAFYFTRGNEIFDPMISKGATGNRTTITGTTSLIYEDGLYWKSQTVTRDSSNLNALTITSDANIHVGGLVKLGGTIYRIEGKTSETQITISGQPKAEYTSALFAIANVVDNEIQETSDGTRSGTAGYGFGYNTPSNDDGDKMVESIINSGTDWVWNASIYSKNISDGPVEIHYVAFDKAGNYSMAGGATGSTNETVANPPVVAANVSNNRPRIANIYVGTDLNGNNEIDGSFDGATSAARNEWSAPYKATSLTWNQDYNYGTAETSSVLGQSDNAYLTAKGKTVIKPEILGGNKKIYYSYSIKDNAGTDIAHGNNATAFITGSSADTVQEDKTITDTSSRQGDITIQVGDFTSNTLKSGGIPDCESNVPHKLEFTFYDETEGATLFDATRTDTAKATLYMAVSMKDKVEPKATRQDLFWKGKGAVDDEGEFNNSVAWNGDTPLGHIDLSDELPDIFDGAATHTREDDSTGQTKYPAAVMDRDSKVSGKIVLRGTVSDNKMLYNIYLKIPQMATQFANAGMVANDTYGYVAATYNAASGKWTSPVGETAAALSSYGIQFTVENNKITSSKHSADWEFIWDTSYVTNVAATNVTVDVYASDQILSSAVATNGPNISLNGTTKYAAPVATENKYSVSDGNKPATLQVDVVPYITGLETFLSGKDENYARTAKGHWPIWMRTDSPKAAGNYNKNDSYRTYEEFKINGFNLGATSLSQTKKQNSGYLVVQTGATGSEIPSINNINGNANMYNQQPGDNNANLTDDVYLDVWQVNGKAADPQDLKAEVVTMKINPSNKMIGFAFRYGTQKKYFAMPNKTTNSVNSYEKWHTANDVQNSVTLAYDANGDSYGTVAGGESGPAYTDRFSIYTSLWGPAGGDNDTDHRNRIEITGQLGESSHVKTQKTDASGNPIPNCFVYTNSSIGSSEHANEKTKHQSPSIATAGTNVYLAYYDELNKELRFRSSLAKGLSTKSDTGNFDDTGTYGKDGHASVTAYTNSTCQIVAQENTPVKGGEYVCIAAIPGASDQVISNTTTKDDVVVIVWYDASSGKVYYSYNTTPNKDRAGKINTQTQYDDTGTDKTTAIAANGWSAPQEVFVSAASGKFCKIAVDGNGGIHIAAYDDINQNVLYAHISNYSGSIQTYIVDGSGAAGENLTLDVALSTGGAVPFIGYYAKGGQLPKFARLAKAGVYGNGYNESSFTGKWEIGFIPTKSDVEQGTINVGVWKVSSTGVLTESEKNDSKVKADTSGVCYGNGTANAVLGYRHTDRATTNRGYIETAQLTGTPDAAY